MVFLQIFYPYLGIKINKTLFDKYKLVNKYLPPKLHDKFDIEVYDNDDLDKLFIKCIWNSKEPFDFIFYCEDKTLPKIVNKLEYNIYPDNFDCSKQSPHLGQFEYFVLIFDLNLILETSYIRYTIRSTPYNILGIYEDFFDGMDFME